MKYLYNLTPLKLSANAVYSDVYSVNFRAAGGQEINFGNHSQLSIPATQAYSISFWMKASSLTQNFNSIVGRMQLAPYVGWEVLIKNQTVEIDIAGAAGALLEVGTSNVITSTSTWYHVCFTYDGSGLAAGIVIYINGSSVSKTVASNTLGTASTVNSQSLTIGDRSGLTAFYQGNVDECSLYNTALSGAQVTAIYNSGHPPDLSLLSSFSSCQLWTRLGDGDNINTNGFIDHSTNGFNGSANTANWFPTDIVADVP